MPSAFPFNETSPTAVIVEDEPALRHALKGKLSVLWPELEIVAEAANGRDALSAVAEHRPDIVFLDIQIPDPNGLEVAREIEGQCHIVFVTAYDAYAVEAFERGVVDYILKPIVDDRLARMVGRLKEKLSASIEDKNDEFRQTKTPTHAPRHMRWITVPDGESLRLITIGEILYFQSDKRRTRLVLGNVEFSITKTLKELMEELDPEQFWQIHRSTIVNAAEIEGVEPNMAGQFTIKLKSRRERLPVSDTFLRKFRKM